MAIMNEDGTISGAPSKQTNLDKVAWADGKVKGIMKVFDQIDTRIQTLSNPKKGEENPEAAKIIDKLTTQRATLVKSLLTPEFFSVAKMSSVNNGDIFLKGIDPRMYSQLSPEQQEHIQQHAAKLNEVGRVQRGSGNILSALE